MYNRQMTAAFDQFRMASRVISKISNSKAVLPVEQFSEEEIEEAIGTFRRGIKCTYFSYSKATS